HKYCSYNLRDRKRAPPKSCRTVPGPTSRHAFFCRVVEDTFQGSTRFVFLRSTDMAEKSRRGFAAMDPAKQREIASKGGKAAHEKGRAHEFTPEQAREAGRKGGLRA